MSLFKIFKGSEADFERRDANNPLYNSSTGKFKFTEGYCYFIQDNGKFYIDIASGESTNAYDGTYRKALNAERADCDSIGNIIIDYYCSKQDINIMNENFTLPIFGICNTLTSQTNKTVTISDPYALVPGRLLSIKFSNDVGENATLNVNNTGAKSITYHGSTSNSGRLKAGQTGLFVYDGASYLLMAIDTCLTEDNFLTEEDIDRITNNDLLWDGTVY